MDNFSYLDMDSRKNEWDLVIKVKYGDTLRRFVAYVSGQAMDYNMTELRARIISLFKFSPDADLLLTYIDEDGDTVTLDDDDELRDAAINQHLNPLRINVQLKSNDIGRSENKYEPPISTPVRSESDRSHQSPISSIVNEALNTLTEPARSALLKLSHDVASKAASSSPPLADMVKLFLSLGLSNAGQPSNCSSTAPGTTCGGPTLPVGLDEQSKISSDPILKGTVSTSTHPVNPVSDHIHKQRESGVSAQGVEAKGAASVDLNVDISKEQHGSNFASVPVDNLWTSIRGEDNVELEKEANTSQRIGKSAVGSAPASMLPARQTVDVNPWSFEAFQPPIPPTYMGEFADKFVGGISTQYPISTAPPTSQFGLNLQDGVPINRMHPFTPDAFLPSGFAPIGHHARRARGHHDGMLRTFHRGVRCDGCGMHPIMGPRFKSKVKEDYDLCNFCFSEVGNEADYTRIDRAPYRSPKLFKEYYNPHSRIRSNLNAHHGCGTRSSRAKLESRFIQDVTVLDGTVMPPYTPFTKIWRMRNNGTIEWPFGTQLVWVGGDQLNQGSVELELPMSGCPVDKEIDIAVDFTAPSRPGRYLSYWRMASPSGQKFGQRVWVLIQVENSQTNTSGAYHADINLNLPPENIASSGLGSLIDVNADPLSAGIPESSFTNKPGVVIEPSVVEIPIQTVESTPVVGLSVAGGGITRATSTAGLTVPYPIIDFPGSSSAAGGGIAHATTAAGPSVPYPIIDFPASTPLVDTSASVDSTENGVEHILLKELESMGFNQIDLNKEILRLNEYDLEQSVDDLCGYSEQYTDPLLHELEQMGFRDKELNKKLLIKNGRSIKRVVLDLIAGEKAD